MKSLLALIGCIALSVSVCAQGTIDFRNSSSSLISANGVAMPVSGTQQFIFAIFLAPSTTVSSTGVQAFYSDPVWQNVGGYNTNTSVVPGRINNRFGLDVGTPTGFSNGSTVDFIVRGWSANAGGTWSEALINWNNGIPRVSMFIGSSTIGNDLILDDEFRATPFGSGPSQVPGFDMLFVPEPSSLTLVGLGLVALRVCRRRSH